MFKKIGSKLFCLHVWTSHAINTNINTSSNGRTTETTREILICSVCGKIKVIEY